MTVLIYIFLALIGVGAYLAVGVAGVILAVIFGFVVLGLSIRFWYITLSALILLLLVSFQLSGGLQWFLVVVTLLFIAMFAIPPFSTKQEQQPEGVLLTIIFAFLCGFIAFYHYIAQVDNAIINFVMSLFSSVVAGAVVADKFPQFAPVQDEK